MTGAILLARIPIFLNFNPDELEALAKLLREQKVKRAKLYFEKIAKGMLYILLKPGHKNYLALYPGR